MEILARKNAYVTGSNLLWIKSLQLLVSSCDPTMLLFVVVIVVAVVVVYSSMPCTSRVQKGHAQLPCTAAKPSFWDAVGRAKW